ncbi:Cytochrome oxidase biogenesis protein Cox11-CtaG, copper delivery to Cox1 [hydrothermal vent metagenome]|uniref:Cytochrome oxidase biogenesis protein Cox11-CtaG, copper delivery to Cox1 n=1 Tax=hydrothermal vent metagenome TaxID=652676 RepID=A0A3B0YB50_9ZZZZ
MVVQSENRPPQTNNRIIGKLLFLVVMMFGFGFALVPLYDVFCDITGLNGKTGDQVNFTTAPIVDKNRLVKVTFLASLNDSMPWTFKPQQTVVEVHPGVPTTITYIAKNNSPHAITGQAVPSVAPGLAAAYFQKTECFCFTQQELKPGEEKIMPVTFIVDSKLPSQMTDITLSYTFFTSPEDKQKPSSLAHNQDNKL